MSNRKNVIILTGGLAGSSVLASLLAKDGYWTGDKTVKKQDYDTWENSELVARNNAILKAANFSEDWTMVFRPEFIDSIQTGFAGIDVTPMKQLIDKCNEHAPWVWKDPRLWLTIRHWRQFIDLSNTIILTIQREPLQAWISTTLRRQIQTLDYLTRYNDGIHRTIVDFIKESDASHVDILYEDLICDPESVIEQINQSANSALSVDDFKSVFRGKLYGKQHGLRHFLLAKAIYFKNFAQRYK